MSSRISPAPPPARPIILVVDDHPINLDVIVKGLTQDGYEILVAEDGEEAIERVGIVRPDLILLDVMLPGPDGLTVCRKLKSQDATREIPVIFMTSLAGLNDKISGFHAGGADYVTKPLQIDEVRARVSVHLQLACLYRELKNRNARLQEEISFRQETEAQLRESHALLQALSMHREETREEERKRIAHDLHEELAQTLGGLRMLISTLPLQHGGGLQEQSREMIVHIDHSLQQMRNMVASLRPSPLDMGIGAGLEWLAQQFTERTGIECALQLPDDYPELSDTQATALFRIAQESLTNVSRQCDAALVRISLSETSDGWCLTIHDDGRSIDLPTLKGLFAILGMEEQARIAAGKLNLAHSPHGGTEITVCLPENTERRR